MELPKVIFVPCPNSHQFTRREIIVHEEVKVGRSVARCKSAADNAIFDCKVLSRSHAVMWYQDGAIWIRDTNSSNGTFINRDRLSRGGEESEPREIKSGDIIQFGVDVMEAKKKDGGNPITHGCIIAKATVTIPSDVLPNPECVINNPMYNSRLSSASCETLNEIDEDQDILELHASIKNLVNREQLLQKKLLDLESRLVTAIEAADLGWQALIKEDKLLARIELLENQLEIFTRGPTEYQNKVIQLEEEKHDYQIHAKDSLRAICLEKSDIASKCTNLEHALTTARIEVSHHKQIHEKLQEELLNSQDQLRKKTAELESEQTEAKRLLEETTQKSAKELIEKQTEIDELLPKLQKVCEEAENKHKETLIAHQEELAALKGEIEELKTQAENAVSKDQYKKISDENTLLKDDNYRLEEELMKLKEELENAQNIVAVVPADIETNSSIIPNSSQKELVDAETNTDNLQRDTLPLPEIASEDQENQMNSVNIKHQDSMSQTDKWFDAISPSSSKSDILSSSFTAGDRKYRSLRQSRRESPRNWSNSNAFEGSIAHAMALIESLDDIKSSCVKFREETTRDEAEVSPASTEESVTDESKPELNKSIGSPMRRRNSYREACEDDTAASITMKEQHSLADTFDDVSETDDQFVLAQEDPADAKPAVILNKVEASASSPKLELSRSESPNNRGSMKSRFKGITSYMSSFWGGRQSPQDV